MYTKQSGPVQSKFYTFSQVQKSFILPAGWLADKIRVNFKFLKFTIPSQLFTINININSYSWIIIIYFCDKKK